MKKRTCMIILIIISFVISCRNSNEKSKQDPKLKTENKINNENYKEKIKEAIRYYQNNPRKFDLYDAGIESFTLMFGFDYLYEQYLLSFINIGRELEVKEEKIAIYLKDLETFNERFGLVYDSLENYLIPEIKNELAKGIDEKGKEVDEKYKKFIELLEEKMKLQKEIEKYYSSGEYKKDNLSKGRELNKKYLDNYEETLEAYKEAYTVFLEKNIVLYANDVSSYKNKKMNTKSELKTARMILKVLKKEFYASSDFEFKIEKLGTIIKLENGNKNYIENLKKIQNELGEKISNLEKADKNSLKEEGINLQKFEKQVSDLKAILQILNEIIVKFETSDYKTLMRTIIKYNELYYIFETEFKN